jgi:transposase
MSWQPATLNRQQQEERRLEGCRLLLESSMSQAEIARHLGVSQVAVAKWKQHLVKHNNDREALRTRSAPGATAQLTTKQWQQVKQMILAGAQASGFASERWTLPRIQQAIRQRFAVQYSTAWLSIRLHQLGISVQRPVPVSRKKDDALVEAWLRKDWPRIKKSVRTRRSHHLR